jgi:hypothetical protein
MKLARYTGAKDPRVVTLYAEGHRWVKGDEHEVSDTVAARLEKVDGHRFTISEVESSGSNDD